MANPSRTVEYIVKGALRGVEMLTNFKIASANNHQDMFDMYIDMITELNSEGWITGLSIPKTLTDPLSNVVPHSYLIDMLVVRSASYFAHMLTPLQNGQATIAYEAIVAKTPVPKRACNPLPQGYFYNTHNAYGFCGDCGDSFNSIACQCPCTSNGLESNQGVNLTSGTTL